MEFKNEKGLSASVLRPNQDESVPDAIARWQEEGWIIPAYEISEDPNGLPIVIPSLPKPKEEDIDGDGDRATD
jgi:hypothetical protein